MDLVTALNEAKENNHTPGYIFDNHICFCKKCNSALTFKGSSNPNYSGRPEHGIFGFYSSPCKGE